MRGEFFVHFVRREEKKVNGEERRESVILIIECVIATVSKIKKPILLSILSYLLSTNVVSFTCSSSVFIYCKIMPVLIFAATVLNVG